MKIENATFVKSASKLRQCPESELPEIAVVGRSNVGKSTLINMLTNRKQLAKSSVKPGKTQLINFFDIDNNRYLVDLPGYGYAKASLDARCDWMDTMYDYLTERPNLIRVFVLIDSRLSPQRIDLEFVKELVEEKIPFDVIFTKSDKVNQSSLHKNTTWFKKCVMDMLWFEPISFVTSGFKKRWWDKVLDYIGEILEECSVQN